jgi:hypothetical protein
MDPILWHRRETRRQTEKTKWILRARAEITARISAHFSDIAFGPPDWIRNVGAAANPRDTGLQAGPSFEGLRLARAESFRSIALMKVQYAYCETTELPR